jgi:hypothetical protein
MAIPVLVRCEAFAQHVLAGDVISVADPLRPRFDAIRTMIGDLLAGSET